MSGNVYLVFEKLGKNGGGVGSLFLRISRWCKMNDIKCYLLTRVIDESLGKIYTDAGTELFIIQNHQQFARNAASFINRINNGIVLTVDFHMYGSLKEYLDSSHELFYYVVYTYGLFNGTATGLKKRLIKLKNYAFRRQYIRYFSETGNIVYMDNDCYNSTMDYYNIHSCNASSSIIMLPMFIGEINENEIKERAAKRRDEFNILTVSRAAFPFKGYLLGLIDICKVLFEKYPNISLTIVAYGDGYDVIREKILEINTCFSNKISLINGVSNDQLVDYYKNSSLYIGMGTTILEASNCGVPALLAKTYDYEFHTSGFFSEHPDCIQAEGDVELGNVAISRAITMDEFEFVELERKHFEMLKNNYNINYFMGKILNHQSQKGASKSIYNFLFSMDHLISEWLYK